MSAEEIRTKEQRAWWTITVSGYGSFQLFATTDEAEEMRRHKAAWEAGRGTKRLATAEEAAAGLKHLKWQQAMGYGLEESELEALK